MVLLRPCVLPVGESLQLFRNSTYMYFAVRLRAGRINISQKHIMIVQKYNDAQTGQTSVPMSRMGEVAELCIRLNYGYC